MNEAAPRNTGRQLARQLSFRCDHVAWLVGAGTSAAAGVPTGYDMVVDFKASLFCEAVGLDRREVDPDDPLWAQRIRSFFDGQRGFPPADDPTEYAVAFESAFPKAEDRRAYIERAISQGSPSYGHRVLGAMLASGKCPAIFTTNFDPLIEHSVVIANEHQVAEGRTLLTVSDPVTADRAERCLRESAWPLLVKLHGDYQSTQLKNTTDELQAQDDRLRRVLEAVCRQFGLLVAGYSGRDHSVMAALTLALEADEPFPGGLFWVLRSGASPLPAVSSFLGAAAERGVDVSLVDAGTFDELAADIATEMPWPAALSAFVESSRGTVPATPVARPHNRARSGFLRCDVRRYLSSNFPGTHGD